MSSGIMLLGSHSHRALEVTGHWGVEGNRTVQSNKLAFNALVHLICFSQLHFRADVAVRVSFFLRDGYRCKTAI